MTTFLLSLLPVSLGIWGIHILFEKDHVLQKLGDRIRGPRSNEDEPLTWREYLVKPLFDCPICMSSVWGTIGFFAIRFFFELNLPLREYLPFIFCLCGLQTIISKLVSKYRIVEEIDTEAFRQLHDLTRK